MNTHISRTPRRRSLSQGMRATFGQIEPPQAGRKSLLAIGVVCLLITGAASADWKVYDQQVDKALRDEIQPRIGNIQATGGTGGSVTGNQKQSYDQLRVKGGTYNPERDETTKTKVADAPEFDDKAGIAKRRCGDSKTPTEQQTVCEAIVKLEEEKYKYLQDMKKISEKRAQDLKAITDERGGIQEGEYGKLESNTNRLLALLAHQRIDDLNLQMAIDTFDERIRERKEYQDYLASTAMDPSKAKGETFDPTPYFQGAAQRVLLEGALQVARARERGYDGSN